MKYRQRLGILLLVAIPGCGDSDNGVVDPPPVLEAEVLGSVRTGAGVPIAGAAVEIQAWGDGCGIGVPIHPLGTDSTSSVFTDTAGGYHALLREEGDRFDACLTVEVEAPPVYHVVPVADTGATIDFNPTDELADTVRIDFVPPMDLPIRYTDVSAGGLRTCGLSTNGAAFCWGRVNTGQIGDGLYPEPSDVPIAVAGGIEFTALATEGGHSCGLTEVGTAYCWGGNPHGQLGIGAVTLGSLSPLAVVGEHTFESITVGATFSCGTATNGTGLCWGNNFVGQLGVGSEDILSPVPTPVFGGLHFEQISGGASATACGVSDASAAYCWGFNWLGSLGDGYPVDPDVEVWSTVPIPVVGGLSFQLISVGAYFTCGLTDDARLYCWGDNRWGQVGDGSNENTSNPTEVATALSFVTVAAGAWHACALTQAGDAYCWGRNDHGQLGDGTQADRYEPTRVQTTAVFTGISAGELYTCAVSVDHKLYCWGKGENGQLGTGTLDDQTTPVQVVDPA